MTRGNNWLTDDQLAEISSGVVSGVEPASPEKCCRFVTDNYARYQGRGYVENQPRYCVTCCGWPVMDVRRSAQ